jgi:MFS transporter, DHA1 family, multidrug resistance protein B
MGILSLHRNLKIRMLDSFISMILGNMLFPFMTIYFAQQFGEKTAGLLLTLNILIGVVANFYGGYLSDRYGRKNMMLIGESTRLVAFVTMMIANSPWLESPVLTFFMFALTGVCWGISGPAADAMMVDVSTPENRKLVYSLQYWAVNLSFVIGGLVGGFLFQSHRFELFLGVVAAQLLSVFLLVFFIEESHQGTKPSPEQQEREQKHSVIREMLCNYRKVFQDRAYMLLILGSLLILGVEFMGSSYNKVRLANEFGLQHVLSFPVDGVQMGGLLAAENSLFVVLLSAFTLALFRKRSEKRMMICGVLFYAIGHATMSLSIQPYVLFALMGITVLGELIWVPIKQSLMAELAPEENRSAYMAVGGLVFRGANVLGSLAVTVGAFLPSWTMAMIFLLSGIFALSLILNVRESRSLRQQNIRLQKKEGIA